MYFYTYLWLRENGIPYYIGKGYGQRAFTSKYHNVHRPTDISRIVVLSRNSEHEAFATEKELIRNWGRLDNGTGCLRNLTDGGEGTVGALRSEQWIAKLVARQNGKRFSEQRRKNISRACMGRESPRKGITLSLETRQKLSQALRGKPLSDSQRQRISEGMRGHACSEETRKKMSISRSLWWKRKS